MYGELCHGTRRPGGQFKKATEILKKHNNLDYHNEAMAKMMAFQDTARDPEAAIDALIERQKKEAIERNKKLLVPVVEAILLCGRNELALRGKRDDGPLNLDVSSESGEGVFRALLRFRANGGDEQLRDLLNNASRNATMISKTIQNELLEIIGDLILERLLDEVKGWPFTVIMDETTDSAGFEDCSVKEIFIGFAHAEETTEEKLAGLLINTVTKFGLNMEDCRGLGVDGASNMLGHMRGCAAIVKRDYPRAKEVHCFNHRLNLALSKSCDLDGIKLTMAVISETYNFIYKSTNRRLRFTKIVDLACVEGRHRRKLVQLCPTRWVERHDAVLVFVEFLPLIALQLFLEEEVKHDSKAGMLLGNIQEPRFLVGLVVAESVLAHSVTPSKQLQAEDGNLILAYELVKDVEVAIKKMRECEADFSKLFQKAEGLLSIVGSTHERIFVPRLCGKQTQRSNVPHKSSEEYFKRSLYIPFLDHVLSELRHRFSDNSTPKLVHLRELLKGSDASKTLILTAAEGEDVQPTLLGAEIDRWILTAQPFKSVEEALAFSKTRIFPELERLLEVLLTLPVTNAEAERSFSVLKLIKTYLRSTMVEERLNGLALLAVHRELDISVQDVIDVFCRKKRRLLLC